MTRIDPHTWIGGYPWRHLPSSDANSLLVALEREGLVGAWVGHLPSAWWRDPALGNRDLVALLAPHRERLTPAPCVRPGWPRWRDEIARAVDVGAAAVRAYPAIVQLGPEDPDWIALGDEVARAGLALILTQRFEDLRQRHPLDTAGDLAPAHVRAIARATGAHLIVGSASRAMIEEVHWGLTAAEQSRVWYDTAWLWGPPEDELAHLMRTIGPSRLLAGSGWPLRLPEQVRAARDLLPLDVESLVFAEAESVREAARAHRQ